MTDPRHRLETGNLPSVHRLVLVSQPSSSCSSYNPRRRKEGASYHIKARLGSEGDEHLSVWTYLNLRRWRKLELFIPRRQRRYSKGKPPDLSDLNLDDSEKTGSERTSGNISAAVAHMSGWPYLLPSPTLKDPSIHPSSSAYPVSGRGGSSSSRRTWRTHGGKYPGETKRGISSMWNME
ncbi:hypothetical protein PFLUV_G00150540 [Perca fluviatilis]|uniref:Uncharacterized protein n=1 Tax=Perca fluviatilis TaxID=8168 RepID=A0A6A5F3X5_PERFL|nr:hypothetical protein PFLUV_G00150540 [Perca fluviatilis]